MQNKVLSLRIWVDADACPNPIKEILFRVAKRLSIETTLVANQPLQIPASPYIKSVQVRSGFDVADGSRDDNKVTKQTERDLKHLILAENSSVYGV
jgi:uncharacterized protein YaiI (UPF0178 family)